MKKMPNSRGVRIRCSPPHRGYFWIMGIVLAGFGVWFLLESDPKQSFAIGLGILLLVIVTLFLWIVGLYFPYRKCQYYVIDAEIRVIRGGRTTKTIRFDAITSTRALGRAVIVKGASFDPIYLYPGDTRDVFVQRIEQTNHRTRRGS